MKRPDLCGKCGIPLYISKLHEWSGKGVIIHNVKPSTNVFLMESENIDAVFDTLDRELGIPIENIVMECTRRGNRRFMEQNVPAPVRRALSYFPRFSSGLAAYAGRTLGFGSSEYVGARRKGDDKDCLVQIIHDPYSLSSMLADALGVTEAFTGKDGAVESFPLGGDSYLVVLRSGEHRTGLEERLQLAHPPLRPVDFDLPRCVSCGLPLELSVRYRWDMKKGFILSKASGRRMVITGFDNYEAVFREIEEEVGEEISQVIVDAQRQFVHQSEWDENWLKDEYTLRLNLMLRGLGYLSAYVRDGGHLNVAILNCIIPKQVVGILQGFYELLSGKDSSRCAWKVEEDGSLLIELS